MKKNNIRKFKYGGTAIAFTVAFVAVVIIVNVIFSALTAKYALYADMTKTNYYGISDATKDLLSDIDDEITIIFCTPLDRLNDNKYSAMVYTLAQEFAAQYRNISIDYMNWETETERVQKYMITAGTTINSRSVIIDCPQRNQSRILTWTSFIAYDTDGNEYGFNGELKFTSSILQITGENPSVYFTTNHSEDISGANALIELFESAGFTVKYIDLTAEEIADDAQIIVVYNPKTDFFGIGNEKNEFDKIDDFTAAYGHLMVFLSAGVQQLPELYSYLYENWYIDIDNVTVTDTAANALSGDGRIIAATYSQEDTPGASLTSSLRSMESAPKAVVSNALSLSIAQQGQNMDSDTFASYILTTSSNGHILKNGAETGTGQYGLLALSSRTTYDDNNEMHDNFVLVSGSAEFAQKDYLNSVSYANSDILYAAMTAMGKDKVPMNIDIKKFEDTSLDITAAQANNWTVVFAAVIPTLFLAMGLVVYIRRRHL